MYPVSARFLEAVKRSHEIVTAVDVYSGGALIVKGQPVAAGSVTVDAKSRVRRTCDLTLAVVDAPQDLTDPLMPNGAEVVLYRGVQFSPGDAEWCPMGVFRVDSVTVSRPTLSVQLRGSDRGILIQDDRFLIPQDVTGSSCKAEIRHLVTQTLPSVTFVDTAKRDLAMWDAVTWERERWDAIDKLAGAINAECFFDHEGRFVMAPEPDRGDPAVFSVEAGRTLISTKTDITRLSTYNAVVVVGDQAGEDPITPQVAYDTDPASVTRWDGPFGHRPMFYSSQFIRTEAQALAAAQSRLVKVVGLPRSLDFTAVPNPALDAGDVVEVVFVNGAREKHIIDRLSIGLGVDSVMSVGTRMLEREVAP
jgi:hypothetical protein